MQQLQGVQLRLAQRAKVAIKILHSLVRTQTSNVAIHILGEITAQVHTVLVFAALRVLIGHYVYFANFRPLFMLKLLQNSIELLIRLNILTDWLRP